MADITDRAKRGLNRAESELDDLGDRIQHQVTELIDRVTGAKEARRQYLSMGLSVGVLVGVIVGIAIGIAMDNEEESTSNPYTNTYNS